jgi:uncharacterized protein YcbX
VPETAAITEIWRYPVASLGGERLEVASISNLGIEGDRTHVLLDLETGEVAAPESSTRWHPALFLRAEQGDVTTVSGPGFGRLEVSPELDEALADHFGFRCGVRAVGTPTSSATCGFGHAQLRYEMAPLHLITTGDMAGLKANLPEVEVGVKRFRANLVIDTGEVSDNWVGLEWSLNGIAGQVIDRTKRCGMTMIAQPGLGSNPEILRNLVRNRQRCMGVYANVGTAGMTSVNYEIRFSRPTG